MRFRTIILLSLVFSCLPAALSAADFLLNIPEEPDFSLVPLETVLKNELDVKDIVSLELPLKEFLFLKSAADLRKISSEKKIPEYHGDLIRQRNQWILVLTHRGHKGKALAILPLVLGKEGELLPGSLAELLDKKRPRSKSNPVVCIDPGHGGRDSGAMDIYRDWPEKKYNNLLSRALAEELKSRGYFVYFTRIPERDTWMDLPERALFAELIQPDLFISIHHNSGSIARGTSLFFSSHNEYLDHKDAYFKYKGQTYELLEQIRNISTITLLYRDARDKTGRLELPKRQSPFVYDLSPGKESLNSLEAVVLFLFELSQDPGFRLHRYSGSFIDDRDYYILRNAPCPAILMETGFINDQEEVQKLRDPGFRERTAGFLADAVDRYFQISSFYGQRE